MTTASRIEMGDEIVSAYELNKDNFCSWSPDERTEVEETVKNLVCSMHSLTTEPFAHYAVYSCQSKYLCHFSQTTSTFLCVRLLL